MSAPDTLKEIVQKKKERIAFAKQTLPEEELKARLSGAGAAPAQPFIPAIQKPRTISLIAEVKKASPSAGVLRQDFDPVQIARVYEEAGVQAISVITEEDFFQGSLGSLSDIRAAVSVPLLRKDFILEPYQVYESRLYGADAILLIADALTKETLSELMEIAASLGMASLVEVHDERQLKKVLNLKTPLIGINNRNLHTLEVDSQTTEKLFPLIPKEKAVVVESGIKSSQDVLFLKILGVSAVLIGSAFMQAADMRSAVEKIMGW